MDRLVEASFVQRDERRFERISVVATLLVRSRNEEQVARVLIMTLGWIAQPVDMADVILATHLLKASLESGALSAVLLPQLVAGFVEGMREEIVSSKLWSCVSLLRLLSHNPNLDAVTFVVRSAVGDLAWVSKPLLPAKCALLVQLHGIGSLVIPHRIQEDILGWLECLLNEDALSAPDFNRRGGALMDALQNIWNVDTRLLYAALERVFGVFRRLVSSGQGVAPLGLSLVLMAVPVSVVDEATHVVMNQSAELDVFGLVELLVQLPLRGSVLRFVMKIWESLIAQSSKEALYRITFVGPLASMILQLFVRSCRMGALRVVESVLLGWQSSPEAFHLALPALMHLVSFLKQELSCTISLATVENVLDVEAQDVSALVETHAVLALESPPQFDAKKFRPDVSLKVFLCELSRVIYDQTQLHTGFFSSLHAPILRLIKPFLDPSYHCDVPSLRIQAWTRGSIPSLTAAQSSKRPLQPVAISAPQPRLNGVGVGLDNLGNTCYLNSVVQAFSHAQSFRDTIVNATGGVKKLHQALASVFVELEKTPFRSISPRSLINSIPPRFRLGEQQDVNEFARALLDELEAERAGAKELWSGISRSRVCCGKCGVVSDTVEEFCDVGLPMAGESRVASLQSMVLERFSRDEPLEGPDRFFCNECKDLTDSRRRIAITKPPELLMITLLRFSFSGGSVRKLSNGISLLDELQVPVVTENGGFDSCYRLFAVIFHAGQSASHGHYFAYCRKSDDVRSDWQLFDDASVRVVGGNEVMKHAEVDSAYTLMFVRKNEI